MLSMTDRLPSSSSTSSNESSSASEEKSQKKKTLPTNESQSRTFRIPSHSDTILQGLNNQRNAGEFCDVTVLVEHQRFSAHKCVLSANSPYFKSLLSTDNDGIFLRHVTAESFKAILDFMYTSRLHLEPTTVQDVLAAAKFLQVKGVVSICCRYLETQIQTLTRDLDEHKKKSNNSSIPPPSVFNGAEVQTSSLPSFQKQPQLTYNPSIGVFEQDIGMSGPFECAFMPTDLPRQSHLLPYQQVKEPGNQFSFEQMQNQPQTTSFLPVPRDFSGSISRSSTLRSRNGNSLYIPSELPKGSFNQAFPNNMPSYVTKPHNLSRSFPQDMPWNNQNYHPSFMPLANKIPSTNDYNPFNFDASSNQFDFPPRNRSNPGHHLFASQSTGGRGKRQNLPLRRRGLNGTVSDTQSLKFVIEPGKATSSEPIKGSETFLSKNTNNECDDQSEEIVLLSCAREAKSQSRNKRGVSPETVFDIEAEDRYWDALSARAPVKHE